MTDFSHLDTGTPEEVWRADARIGSVPRLEVDLDELVVVAAHPDDETLGAAGLIRRVHCGGGGVTVVVATDGEASHPRSPTHSRTDLSSIRRVEVLRAVQTLAPRARVVFLGIADGGLRESSRELEAALAAVLDALPAGGSRVLVVAPWSGDGHRDHRIAAECVRRVTGERGIAHLGYPIWMWHWGRPDDVPWGAALALALSPGERSVKARALHSHASQTQPLSDAPGDEPIVPTSMQAHFERDAEVYLREGADGDRAPGEPETARDTLPTSFFDDFYARHEDPWGFETRWYEERKRAILLASLPDRALGRVLEIGCATGLITGHLAARAESVRALDASAAALVAARARFGDDPVVTLQQGAVPEDWPDGAFETIVLSEVGYYLSSDDLELTIRLMESALTQQGHVIACHWRHPVAEYPLSGDQVHHALRSVSAWDTLVRHEEEDFLLEVFCRRPAVSVARREGLG